MSEHLELPMDIVVSTDVGPVDLAAALAADARSGLSQTPKELPPKWFYDAEGARLFGQISRLPGYYLTRAEEAILARRAGEIALVSGADTLVELGPGGSDKSRVLLDALREHGSLRRYVPFDVDEVTLERTGLSIAAAYPGVQVHAVCGDLERHLSLLPPGGRRLIAFLGGTIGNLRPAARGALFAELRAGMRTGDALLLGADLVKDTDRMIAAYDDPGGVTAAFNRNILRVLDRTLHADADPAAFEHLVRWDPCEEWMEMWLVAREDMIVHIGDLGIDVRFAAGERMRTEVSAKFRRDGLRAELADAGLELSAWWTDAAQDYSLSLSVVA